MWGTGKQPGFSPPIPASVGEMLNCGEVVPFFFTVVFVLMSKPDSNRAHLVDEIFVMSLCGPRAVGEK